MTSRSAHRAPRIIASLAPGGAGGFTLTLRVVDVAEAAQLAFATSTYAGLPSSADVRKLIATLGGSRTRAVNQLQSDEQATDEDPTYLDREASNIAATYKRYQQSDKDWNSWGQIAVVTGSAALVVGSTILIVGLVALD